MNNSRYFSSTPPVVLNLIIINALMLLATELLPVGNRIVGALALFNVESPLFHSYQLVTYMFLHGGFSHLFFNTSMHRFKSDRRLYLRQKLKGFCLFLLLKFYR